MEEKEYLTIAEVAERSGRSKQAIYSRLSTSLSKFVKEIDGKKHLHFSVLETFDSTSLNKDSIKVEQGLIDVLKEQLDLLRQQLEVKDRQIDDLNNRLEQALERNRESNILLAQGKSLQLPESTEFIPWYKRIFGRNTTPKEE